MMTEHEKRNQRAWYFVSGALAIGTLLLALVTIACSGETTSSPKSEAKTPAAPHNTPTATSTPIPSAVTPRWKLQPFSPMFTLTPFAPTATPAARPIPPLPDETQVDPPQALPGWLETVSPVPGSKLPLSEFQNICIVPVKGLMEDYAPALKAAFQAGNRARDHLYIKVNGIVPSELTWQQIVVPNSTHPGTAWVGTRTYDEFCWIAEITTGTFEVVLFFPTETGSGSFTWQFTITNG